MTIPFFLIVLLGVFVFVIVFVAFAPFLWLFGCCGYVYDVVLLLLGFCYRCGYVVVVVVFLLSLFYRCGCVVVVVVVFMPFCCCGCVIVGVL